jgi:hypothetical protein
MNKPKLKLALWSVLFCAKLLRRKLIRLVTDALNCKLKRQIIDSEGNCKCTQCGQVKSKLEFVLNKKEPQESLPNAKRASMQI